MRKTPENNTVFFFPWLTLKESVTAKNVRFVTLRDSRSQIREEFTAHSDSLELILSSYVNAVGNPVSNCTIACIRGRDPAWSIEENDLAEIQEATLLVMLAAFSENDYLSPYGKYANSSMFQAIAQRFTEPVRYMRQTIRRRDGYRSVIGGEHGKMKFTIPPQCESTSKTSADVGFLRALSVASDQDSKVMARLRSAVAFYQLANTDSFLMPEDAELILTASAIEQLLDAENCYRLTNKFGNLLRAYGSSTVGPITDSTRPGILLKAPGNKSGNKPTPQEIKQHKDAQRKWFVHRKWIEELYDLRSFLVHGTKLSKRQWGWSSFEHLVMGAFAFPLIAKLLLHNEGHYQMTDEDETRCMFMDMILSEADWYPTVDECADDFADDCADTWGTTLLKAQRRQHLRKRFQYKLEADRVEPLSWSISGLLLEDEGMVEEAEIAMQKAIEADPGNPEWHMEYAWFHSRQGRLGRALIEAHKALRIDPTNGWVNAKLGFIYLKKGSLEVGRKWCQEAVELEPENTDMIQKCHYERGRALARCGRRNKALEQFEAALQVDSDFVPDEDIKAEIEKLR